MKTRVKKRLVFYALLSIGFFVTDITAINAQNHAYSDNISHDNYNRWAVRISGGTGIFLGDIKQNPLLPSSSPKNEWRFGGSAGLEYRINPVFSLKGQAIYSPLAGTKTKSGFFFDATIIESSLTIGVYPVNIFSLNNGRIAEFHIFGGLGLLNFDAELFDLNNNQLISSSGNGNGSGLAGRTLESMFLAGFGIDFPIHSKWMISFETSNKVITNDKMDLTVSQFKYDVYNFTSIGLTYRFGSKISKRSSTPLKETSYPDQKQTYLIPQTPVVVENESVETKAEEAPSFNNVITIPVDTVLEVDTSSHMESVETKPTEFFLQNQANSGYRVQILASSKQYDLYKLSSKTALPKETLEESRFNGLYIYVTGWFKTMEDALTARDNIRKNNATPDAWVVYFENGQRQKTMPKTK